MVDVRCVGWKVFVFAKANLFRSCRKRGDRWFIAMNRWQDITDMEVSQGGLGVRARGGVHVDDYLDPDSLDLLSQYCSEFLVHAADVEGLCQGIDEDLVASGSI